MKKTFDEILKYGVEGYSFRECIDNFTDDQIRECVEDYAYQKSEVKQLIEKQKEYIQLMQDELNDVVGMASIHGWQSTRVEQGQKIREEISELKKL